MNTRIVRTFLLLTAVSGAGTVFAQVPSAPAVDVRGELIARGAPADLATEIQQIVIQSAGEGLPVEALADKALEGWAKGAPADRLLVAVRDLRHRLSAARLAATEVGIANPTAPVVAAAAQALGRGMTMEDVRTLIRAARRPDAAATGLMVASSLAAQGIERAAATRAVEQALKEGHSSSEVLELPSLAASLRARGMTLAEVTHRMLAGNPLAVERPDISRAADAPVLLVPPITPEQTQTKKP